MSPQRLVMTFMCGRYLQASLFRNLRATHTSLSQSQAGAIPSTPPRSKKHRKRKPRAQLSFWEYHYKQLKSLVTPFHEYHRNDITFRKIWLTDYSRNQKYQFKSNPHRLRLQHRRWAFIFAQRKRLARQKHIARQKWHLQRKRNERLYRLAYVRFKKGRVELWRVWGKLEKAYRLGWTADREWRAWKRLLHVRNANRKPKQRWKRRTNYVLDDLQRSAERRMFDAFSRDSKRDQ